jgi:IS5 family transposase
VRKNTTYRGLLDEPIEMPRILRVLGLAELSVASTLCKAFNRIDMAAWRVILTLSATLLRTSGVVGIDASGFDRSHASKHYTKRAELTIQQLKVTLLVDTKVNAMYGAFVRSRRWWKQFRELTIACLVHNVDRSL